MKNKNYKYLVGIIIGLLLVTSVYGASSLSSSDVIYDGDYSFYSSGDIQGAIDDLSGKMDNVRPTTCPSKTYCIPYKYDLEVGDYVSYIPEVTSYPVDTSITGYTGTKEQVIYPEELELWRVLNINNDGTVDLISEYVSSTAVYFNGLTGYKNLVGYLNVLAEQYETEGITDEENGSRYFGFDGQTEYITDTSMFTSTPPFGCTTNETTCSNTEYPNDPDDYEAYGGGDRLYKSDYDRVNTVLGTGVAYKVGTTTATSYWMASRYYTYSSPSDYKWNGRSVYTSGNSNYYYLYKYDSGSFYENSGNHALRPIVTLKAGLQYEGTGIKENPMKIITS